MIKKLAWTGKHTMNISYINQIQHALLQGVTIIYCGEISKKLRYTYYKLEYKYA
jgi:hypothetical protein